MMHQPIV